MKLDNPHASHGWFLRIALFAALGAFLIIFSLTRPAADKLQMFGLLALWVFLSIPACCGLRR